MYSHQRLPDLLALDVRHGALLVPAAAGGAPEARARSSSASACCSASPILADTIVEKFEQGGWITLAVTGLLVALCFLIRRHYRSVGVEPEAARRRSSARCRWTPTGCPPSRTRRAPTAVDARRRLRRPGRPHHAQRVPRPSPGIFKNLVFVSVGVIDSGTFKGIEEVERVRSRPRRRWGSTWSSRTGSASPPTTAWRSAPRRWTRPSGSAGEIAKEFPRAVFFAGKLIFQKERIFQRLLHNETAYLLQRRLQFAGMNAMVMPVRVLE